MYFNETNNTNIDKELKKNKKIGPRIEKVKEKKVSSGSKFRFSPDTLLMCFYGLLLIVGIILIIVSLT